MATLIFVVNEFKKLIISAISKRSLKNRNKLEDLKKYHWRSLKCVNWFSKNYPWTIFCYFKEKVLKNNSRKFHFVFYIFFFFFFNGICKLIKGKGRINKNFHVLIIHMRFIYIKFREINRYLSSHILMKAFTGGGYLIINVKILNQRQ